MRFPTTCWTHLAQATLHGDPAGQRALEEMCTGYRGQVEAYVAERGLRGQEAEDAVQELLLSWLKSRAWKRADRPRGKVRTFLLGALQHMLNRLRERHGARKRGGVSGSGSRSPAAERKSNRAGPCWKLSASWHSRAPPRCARAASPPADWQ